MADGGILFHGPGWPLNHDAVRERHIACGQCAFRRALTCGPLSRPLRDLAVDAAATCPHGLWPPAAVMLDFTPPPPSAGETADLDRARARAGICAACDHGAADGICDIAGPRGGCRSRWWAWVRSAEAACPLRRWPD